MALESLGSRTCAERGTWKRAGTRTAIGCALALALALALGAVGCGDATDAERAASTAERETRVTGAGQMLYLTYCQACHGASGTGDGPAATALRTPPADLTRLSERYGTPLDRERLARYIDGRRLLGGHDVREMPIWGEEFFEGVPPTTPNLENARARLIDVLVGFLETLQRERSA